METELTVLILAKDEAANLETLIPEIREALATIRGPHEILVVDGNSRDGTAEVARRLGARVIVQSQPGYGAAFREGMAAARGRFIAMLDADGSHHPFYLRQLFAHRLRADVVIGSRYTYQGHYHGQRLRHILSRFLNLLFARVLSLPIRDLSSGLRLYRRRAVVPVLAELVGRDFEILEEVLVRIWARGSSLAEIPIHFRPRGAGASKAHIVRFGCRYARILRRLWRIRNSLASADYDDRAFGTWLLPQRWWQRRRYRAVLDLLGRPRGMILDAGCGSSKILAAMPQAIGLDANLAKLRFRRNTNTRLVCGDCRRLPFADGVFPAVLSSEVIEHVREADRCLDELARVIAPGGILVVGTPDYGRWIWRATERLYQILMPHGYADEHVTRFTRASLLRALEARGLRADRHRYVFGGELIVRARKEG